jgi:hypothetical protein
MENRLIWEGIRMGKLASGFLGGLVIALLGSLTGLVAAAQEMTFVPSCKVAMLRQGQGQGKPAFANCPGTLCTCASAGADCPDGINQECLPDPTNCQCNIPKGTDCVQEFNAKVCEINGCKQLHCVPKRRG